jgi:hypothetical protein
MTYKAKNRKYWEEEVLEKVVRRIKEIIGIKRDYSKKYFTEFILKKLGERSE